MMTLKKKHRSAVFVLAAVLVAFVFAILAIQSFLAAHRSPTIYTNRGEFRMRLVANKPPVFVRVTSIEKQSTSAFDAQDIRSAKIEILNESVTNFTIPYTHDCGARSVQVADLSGDGIDEVILYGGMTACIVSSQNGELAFRPELDTVSQNGGIPHPVEMDKSLVFKLSGYPPNGRMPGIGPRLFSWTPQRGFVDVTREHPQYVNNELIPELERRLREEADPEIQRLYRATIKDFRMP